MDDAKKVFAVFLALLFIIILAGVLISRVGKNTKGQPLLGAIDMVFFPKRATITPTPKAKDTSSNTVTTEQESSSTTDSESKTQQKTTADEGEKGSVVEETDTIPTDTESVETKGGQKAEVIPETGTPEIILVLALIGLASGIYLKKYA